MMTNASFDDRLAAWLEEDSVHRVPDHLDEVLVQTRAMRQRAWWSSPGRWLPVQTTLRLVPVPKMPAIIVVVALLLAIAVAIVAVGSRSRLPEPFGPARNGALVYGADGDIYRLDTAAGAPSVIVGGAADDHGPVFSHDGSKLLFQRSTGPNLEQVVVASADGSDPRPVTGDLAEIGSIDWSPDGSQLAMVHALNGRSVLSIIDATGKEPIRTLDVGDLWPFELIAWRPEEGGSLFFTAEPKAGSGVIGIYAVGPDGSTVRPVAPPLPNGGVYGGPSISADGGLLTYSNFEPSVIDGRTDGWSHVLDLATGDDRQVRLGDLDAEINGQFSPDGSRILYERQRILPDGDYDRQIVVGPADGDAGGATVEIGAPFGHEDSLTSGFAFSPDGQQVVLTIGPTTQVYNAADGTPVGEPMTIGELPSYQRLAP
jgi:WD40 repeat protein